MNGLRKFLVTCWQTPKKCWQSKPPVHQFINSTSPGIAILDVKNKLAKDNGFPREKLDRLNWNAELISEIPNYGTPGEIKVGAE